MHKNIFKHPLFILICCFTLLFFFLYQDYGGGNHNQYLVQYYKAQDSSFLANDAYANQTEGYTVRFYFTQLLLFTHYLIPSERALFFILTLLFTLGFGITLYYFANYFYHDPQKSALFSLLLYVTIDTTFIGTAPLFSANLTPNMIAYFFSFLSLNFILRKHSWLGFFILSIATLFQPIIAGIAFLFGVIILLYQNRKICKQYLTPLAFFPLSLVQAIPLLFASTGGDSAKIAYIVAYFRHPWHSLPSSWKVSMYLASCLLVILAYVYLYRMTSSEKTLLAWLMGAGIFLTSLTYFFVELYPISFIAKAQMARAFAFVTLFAFLIIFDYLYTQFFRTPYVLERIFIILFLSTLFTYLFRYAFILASIVFLGIFFLRNYCEPFSKKILLPTVGTGFVVLFLVFFFAQQHLFSFYQSVKGFIPSLHSLLLLAILFSLYFFCCFWIFSRKKHTLPFFLITLVLSISILFFLPIQERAALPPAEQALCTFVRANTATDAIFLSPPVGSLRLCMQRAQVVDFKAVPFNDQAMTDWYERILAVTNNHIQPYDISFSTEKSDLNTWYHTHTQESLEDLSQDYPFDYALFSQKMPLSQPLVYSGDTYYLYDFRGENPT